MNLIQVLNQLNTVIIEEVERNPDFAQRLTKALSGTLSQSMTQEHSHIKNKKKLRIRAPALLDPMAILTENGEDLLRLELKALTIEKLQDIVAEFAMDSSKLVMKWKSLDRIIDHIIESAKRRIAKGDAFRV